MVKALCILILFTTSLAASLRPLALEGNFYPADRTKLQNLVRDFFKKAGLPKSGKPRLLMAPHDRLWRSGLTAAIAYQQLRGHHYETIILIGPYHADNFHGAAVWAAGDWEDPEGILKVDTTLANKIAQSLGDLQKDSQIHAREHSLETQLPFLQQVQPDTPIVPILISNPTYYKNLAAAILPHIRGRNILIIISTDLSHEHPLAEARVIDQKTLWLIRQGQPEALARAIDNLEVDLCGCAPVLTGLEIARTLKWKPAQILHVATNAPYTGDETAVVGYAAAVVVG